MFAAQTDRKRMKFRKIIRDKHIQDIFRINRLQYLNNSPDNYQQNIQNIGNELNMEISPNPHLQGSARRIQNWQGCIQKIEALLNHNNMPHHKNIFEGDINALDDIKYSIQRSQHISNENLRRIWQIVVTSGDEICTNESIMGILIKNAKHDIKMIIKSNGEKERDDEKDKMRGKKTKCQRIGQILWILSNECYKNSDIGLQITEQIVKLCLQIIRNKAQKPKHNFIHNHQNPQYQSQQIPVQNYQQFDEYIIGLCILLMGNICLGKAHVNCILNNVKLSSLLQMMDGILDENNCQDLSFVISNILFYYPQLQINDEDENDDIDSIQESEISKRKRTKDYVNQKQYNSVLLQLKQQQFQLSKILYYLENKLYKDLIIYIHNLNHTNNSSSPTQNNSKLDNSFVYKSQHKQNNNNHGYMMYSTNKLKYATETRQEKNIFNNSNKKVEENASMNINKDKNMNIMLELSGKELEKIKQIQNIRNKNNIHHNSYEINPIIEYKQSQNYTNDLMQCIGKVKSILYEIYEKQEQYIQEMEERKEKYLKDKEILKYIEEESFKSVQSSYNGEKQDIELKVKELRRGIQKITRDIKDIEIGVLELSIKLLFIFQSKSKQNIINNSKCSNQYGYVNIFKQNVTKLKNTLIFLRDIFRSFKYLHIIINQHLDIKINQDKFKQELILYQIQQIQQLQQYLIKKYGEHILNYIHKLILMHSQNAYRDQDENNEEIENELHANINNNKQKMEIIEIQDSINNAIWEIYGYIMEYISGRRGQKSINNKNQENQMKQLLNKEIDWLEQRLISHVFMRDNNSTLNFNNSLNTSILDLNNSICSKKSSSILSLNQQCKVLEILTKYYPIINAKYEYKKSTKKRNSPPNARRNIFKDYEDDNEVEQEMLEHIEIDMHKIRDILGLLRDKLIQHKDYPFIICRILRGILTIITRQRQYLSKENKDNNQLEDILGSTLYNYIRNELVYKYGEMSDENDNVNSQIGEVLQEILNNEENLMEEEKFEIEEQQKNQNL